MPNWDDENGRFWWHKPGTHWPHAAIQIPHPPFYRDGCTCALCKYERANRPGFRNVVKTERCVVGSRGIARRYAIFHTLECGHVVEGPDGKYPKRKKCHTCKGPNNNQESKKVTNKKASKKAMYVVDTRHNETADPHYMVASTYDEAVEYAHEFFESYGFTMKDMKPFDDGNDDGEDGGFDVFDNVTLHNGKVAEFMHCDGDGPVCRIALSRN